MSQIISYQDAKENLPSLGDFDVLVCGGGLGGVAAAIAAARSGAKTLLIERNSCLGGTATSGMCCSIFNCYFTGDDKHELKTYGIPVEIADALAEASGYGLKWRKHKGHIIYDMERGKEVLQELVLASGADILLQTWSSAAIMEGSKLKGVVTESKSGRCAIYAKAVVDATGDADIAAFSGAPVKSSDPAAIHSLCFRLGNVDVDKFVDYFDKNREEYSEYMDIDWNFEEALEQYRDCGTFLFPHGGGMQMKAFKEAKAAGDFPPRIGSYDCLDACQMHALRQTGVVHVITGFTRNVSGCDAVGLSQSIVDGRRIAYILLDVYRKRLPGFENCFVCGVADNLGVRTSRWLDSQFSFKAGMTDAGVRQFDAVGEAVGYKMMIKHPGNGAWGVQVCNSDSFDIPMRCLLPENVEGLIMGTGRSISADNPSVLRVMVHTMVIGQGAGIAAAMAAGSSTSFRKLDPAAMKKHDC